MINQTPSSLSFKGSIRPTDALLGQSSWDAPAAERPLEIVERKNGGVFASMKDIGKRTEMEVMGNNPTLNDRAILDPDRDTLVVRFGLDIVGNTARPHACNAPEFIPMLRAFHDAYALAGGFEALAERYVRNLAGGAWLWRNLDAARAVRVALTSEQGNFPSLEIDGDRIPASFAAPLDAATAAELAPAIAAVAQALRAEGLESIDVVGHVRLGAGREVYPSQVFPVAEKKPEDAKRSVTDKSRKLFARQHRGMAQAAMRSEKLGAALRMIDTWHGGAVDDAGAVLVAPETALVVNPYGQYRPAHVAVRYRNKAKSLRSILRKMDAVTDALASGPDTAPSGEAHFLMANFARGGVMGEKG